MKLKKLFLLLAVAVSVMTFPACEKPKPVEPEVPETPEKPTKSGLFSVSDSTQVRFALGNLQYKASTNTWRIAENQWDFIGGCYDSALITGSLGENANISADYDGWIDLFGWGTSGWDCGNVYYRPYDHVYYLETDTAANYGPKGDCNLTGEYANSDWGVFNRESLGGNNWRTLTRDEWRYIISGRDPFYTLNSKGIVNGVIGYIFLPDDWDFDNGISFTGHAPTYDVNTFTGTEWDEMERLGAVFLPAAGRRWGNFYFNNWGVNGDYWSSITYSDFGAECLHFDYEYIHIERHYRSMGLSVRLVEDEITK